MKEAQIIVTSHHKNYTECYYTHEWIGENDGVVRIHFSLENSEEFKDVEKYFDLVKVGEEASQEYSYYKKKGVT